MNENLFVYYSRTGRTKQVAEYLQGQLGGDLEVIVDKKNRKGVLGAFSAAFDNVLRPNSLTKINDPVLSPADYKNVYVLSPIWAGSITPAVRTYLKTNSPLLPKVTLITTSKQTAYELGDSLLAGYNIKCLHSFSIQNIDEDSLDLLVKRILTEPEGFAEERIISSI